MHLVASHVSTCSGLQLGLEQASGHVMLQCKELPEQNSLIGVVDLSVLLDKKFLDALELLWVNLLQRSVHLELRVPLPAEILVLQKHCGRVHIIRAAVASHREEVCLRDDLFRLRV